MSVISNDVPGMTKQSGCEWHTPRSSTRRVHLVLSLRALSRSCCQTTCSMVPLPGATFSGRPSSGGNGHTWHWAICAGGNCMKQRGRAGKERKDALQLQLNSAGIPACQWEPSLTLTSNRAVLVKVAGDSTSGYLSACARCRDGNRGRPLGSFLQKSFQKNTRN